MKASEFKEAIRTGRTVVGLQQFLPLPALTEMAGFAGFDWVWLCTEHGSIAIGTELENLTRTADAMGLTSIVRITHNDYSIILRSLELGANGVLVPRVRTRADVEHTVEWVKYPPLGTRGICGITRLYGYGTRPRAPEDMNDETIVMILIEEVEAFDHLDDILSVPELDCAMFGGGDLSLQLGLKQRVEEGDPRALEIVDGYRSRFIETCQRHGVAISEPIGDLTKVSAMAEDGVTVFASSPDTGLIQGAMTRVIQGTRRDSQQASARSRV
jgi:4-hydroxy-2-oxoheptanedioate aldolase